jgi:hypothetical protein
MPTARYIDHHLNVSHDTGAKGNITGTDIDYNRHIYWFVDNGVLAGFDVKTGDVETINIPNSSSLLGEFAYGVTDDRHNFIVSVRDSSSRDGFIVMDYDGNLVNEYLFSGAERGKMKQLTFMRGEVYGIVQRTGAQGAVHAFNLEDGTDRQVFTLSSDFAYEGIDNDRHYLYLVHSINAFSFRLQTFDLDGNSVEQRSINSKEISPGIEYNRYEHLTMTVA